MKRNFLRLAAALVATLTITALITACGEAQRSEDDGGTGYIEQDGRFSSFNSPLGVLVECVLIDGDTECWVVPNPSNP